MTMLQAVIPAAKGLRRRKLRIKERPSLNQLEFSKLLEELDSQPRSHAGLVVRFLAHTGLRSKVALARSAQGSNFRSEQHQQERAPARNSICERHCRRPEDAAQGDWKQGDYSSPRRIEKVATEGLQARGGPATAHHSFRHLFATRVLESGVDLPTAARWLGHMDGGALLSRTYFHLVDEHSRRMAAKVKI